MNKEEFKNLKRGDIVKHKMKTDSYVVDHNLGNTIIVVRTTIMTQPDEWDLIEER